MQQLNSSNHSAPITDNSDRHALVAATLRSTTATLAPAAFTMARLTEVVDKAPSASLSQTVVILNVSSHSWASGAMATAGKHFITGAALLAKPLMPPTVGRAWEATRLRPREAAKTSSPLMMAVARRHS